VTGLWWEAGERAAAYDPRHDYPDDGPDAQDLAELHTDLDGQRRAAERERDAA
jgi:hypothetical protein